LFLTQKKQFGMKLLSCRVGDKKPISAHLEVLGFFNVEFGDTTLELAKHGLLVLCLLNFTNIFNNLKNA
jgi:hypothetical protein